MKANAPENNKRKAPDKIYACFGVFGLIQATEIKATSKDIEYIRKDAFIEKACDFFEENIEEKDCKIGSSEWVELRAEYKSLDSFIRAFVRYMKGE